MSLWKYFLWRLVKAIIIVITAPVWFPVLCITYALVIVVGDWVSDVYDDWCRKYQ